MIEINRVINEHSKTMLLIVVLLLSSVTAVSNSYKILALFPHPGKSHVDVFVKLMKGLAEKGHKVTVISHFPVKNPVERYKDISLEASASPLINVIDLDQVVGKRSEKWSAIFLVHGFAKLSCEAALQSPGVQQFIRNNNNTFVVIIAEFFNSDCFLGFVHKFRAPLIGLSSSTIPHWINARMGNPTHPAYIPNSLMDYSHRMAFFERVENVLLGFFQDYYFQEIIGREDEMLSKKYFGTHLGNWREVIFNCSLLLVNTHFSLNFPRPLVPAVVEIGGIHVSTPRLPPAVSKPIKLKVLRSTTMNYQKQSFSNKQIILGTFYLLVRLLKSSVFI